MNQGTRNIVQDSVTDFGETGDDGDAGDTGDGV